MLRREWSSAGKALRDELEQKLGRPVRAFAAPYGRVNHDVLADVARTYEIGFGTRLRRALPVRDPYDVPRIEMHYFRSPRRWREFIEGASGYFQGQRVLRAVRQVVNFIDKSAA